MDHLGPYRLEERLGAGGMGEVFRAYDERLDRRVAIKVIRPGAGESTTARARFRREARLAARLSHPAIATVYDFLESEHGDCIVMELVDGRTLSALLCDDPPPLSRAVDLARQVAEGLAAAHAQGVLHRDLKTENVIVTAAGQAKLVDFGLARRREALSEELSAAGAILGTVRAMSPEQARGRRLDERSDLFSLGTLLYESVTGRSPFRGGDPVATLVRICTYRQAPAHEANPGIPESLSVLIDRLLEKDPDHRPQSAAEVAAALRGIRAALDRDGAGAEPLPRTLVPVDPALEQETFGAPARPAAGSGPQGWTGQPSGGRIAGAGILLLLLLLLFAGAGAGGLYRLSHPTAAAVPPLHVAVARPTVARAPDSVEADLLAGGIRLALLKTLMPLRRITTPPPDQVDAVAGTPVAQARAVAADEVLTSSLDCGAAVCRVSLSRVSGSDGHLLGIAAFEVPVDDFHLLAAATASQAAQLYPDRGATAASPAASRAGDLRRLLSLRRDFEARRGSLDEVLTGLAALRREAPQEIDAYLLESEVALYRYHELSRDPADLQRALTLLESAHRLAPADPDVLLRLAAAALAARRRDRAAQVLQELDRLAPGRPEVLALQARLAELGGDAPRALELLRTAARRRPSWKLLFNLANLELRRGQGAAARQDLDSLLARAPGQLDAMSLRAEIELSEGSLTEAERLYAELARRSPGVAELTNLGTAQLLLGRRGEAVASFRAAAALAADNPIVLFSLADALLIDGREAEAAPLYRRVLALLAADPAARKPQLLTVQAQARAHLGDYRGAVTAAEEALRLAPDNPQVLYEASLVDTLAGEDAAALAHAEGALSRGFGARWFAIPFFDRLRARPDFTALLRRFSPRP
jgi:serine/threonine-protein kinase